MARAGVAEERRQKREEAAAKANELAQSARVTLLEAKRKALESGDERADACYDLAIKAIDSCYPTAR